MTLEDDYEILEMDDDDWESVHAEETQHIERRTYSDVLRGNDRDVCGGS